MRNYSFRIFHILIIACIFTILSGCGYKAAPVYDDGSQVTQKTKEVK